MIHSVTSFDIEALIDNELDWETEKLVINAINSDRHLKELYNRLMKQKKLLQQFYNQEKTSQ